MTIELTEGKITANRNLLNLISIAFMEAADKFNMDGCYGLADDAKENSNRIYKTLEASGFYKDC